MINMLKLALTDVNHSEMMDKVNILTSEMITLDHKENLKALGISGA